jgi:hypothetical protein
VESEEQPCPYCKSVHYSSYNAERCAARHDAISQMPGHKNKHRENKPKPMPVGNGNRPDELHHHGNPAVANGSPTGPAPVQK